MGFYEKALGLMIMPAMLLFLVLLAFIPARGTLNKVIMQVIGVKIHINGIGVPLLPFLAIFNLMNIYGDMEKI